MKKFSLGRFYRKKLSREILLAQVLSYVKVLSMKKVVSSAMIMRDTAVKIVTSSATDV